MRRNEVMRELQRMEGWKNEIYHSLADLLDRDTIDLANDADAVVYERFVNSLEALTDKLSELKNRILAKIAFKRAEEENRDLIMRMAEDNFLDIHK